MVTHAAQFAGWPLLLASVGVAGAALPLLRRSAWSVPTRNIHLVMCAVAIGMLAPGAPWWLLLVGPLVLGAAAAQLFRTAHGSPECIPCLLDAVAMSLMLLIAIVVTLSSGPMPGHAGSSFALLGLELGVGWALAACWFRTKRNRPVPVAGVIGSVLMAGSMSAMFLS